MKRPRLILEAALVASLAAYSSVSPAQAGSETQQAPPTYAKLSDYERETQGPLLFKIQASKNIYELPEGSRNYKRPPTVDAGLVGQILQVRTGLPSWRGIPHMAPGGGRSAL